MCPTPERDMSDEHEDGPDSEQPASTPPESGAEVESGSALASDRPPRTAHSPRDNAVGTSVRSASYTFLVVVTVVNLVADLWSKSWAKDLLENKPPDQQKFQVVDRLFDKISVAFTYAENKGGAWGLLQNETEALRRPFFLIVSVAAIVFIVSLYRKLQKGQLALKWGLPLVLGGALGNLVDRIRYGFVVDFIDVYVHKGGAAPDSHWPTFNVADVAICVGVGLMAIDMFTSRKKRKPKDAASSSDSGESVPPSEPDDDTNEAAEGA